ncbi:MAG: glycosyltransferase family 2 protein [Firmicutes bacterium]|nr:glycosyltransferase family 2 protein [Bacillota bacterium]
MDISIQICTYNREHLIGKALEALFNQNYDKDKYEIVLIDDGSTDGTADVIKSLKPPCKFTYIHQQNSGLSKGRNVGIRAAQGEIVLFVDDDIMASENLIAEHMKIHREFPKSVVRGWVNHVDDLDKPGKQPKFTMQDISTAFFWTSNVSVAKKYLEEAGLFDETFTEYGWEDLELGLRLRALGLTLKYNRNAIVSHYKSRWKKTDLPKLLNQARSKGRTAVIFVDKHPTMRVKMATGIHAPRFILNDILELGGLGVKFCQSVVDGHEDDTLEGFPLFCAHQLYKFEYYKTIKDELDKQKTDGE